MKSSAGQMVTIVCRASKWETSVASKLSTGGGNWTRGGKSFAFCEEQLSRCSISYISSFLEEYIYRQPCKTTRIFKLFSFPIPLYSLSHSLTLSLSHSLTLSLSHSLTLSLSHSLTLSLSHSLTLSLSHSLTLSLSHSLTLSLSHSLTLSLSHSLTLSLSLSYKFALC